ncbi:MAG: DUF1275 domain-containing protein [Myxococcaceae bacterium]|jgi:uncharacterized membrane protein YoaK (UPF0700 family)|nr:DUF1275 domain-containing protein [Myxococcaceae bacterium]
MLRRHTPGWVYAGGLLLTAVAGCVNAVAVASAYHAVTHMTGTLFSVSFEASRGHADVALRAAAVVACFFAGATLCGVLVRRPTLWGRRRYGVALLVEGGMLFGAWLGLRERSASGEVLAAVACGLQNALATSYSGAVVRTTHMTGIVTDLGLATGHWLRRQPVEWFRVRLHLVLLTGFVAGGAAGTAAFGRLGAETLLLPAGAVALAGTVALARRPARAAEPPASSSAGS